MAVVERPTLECVTRRSAFLRLWLLGLIGAAIAAAEPLPANLLFGARLPELALRAITFCNAALVLAVLVALGSYAAKEVGLYSVMAPQVPRHARPQDHAFHWVQAALLVGIAVGAAQALFDVAFWRLVPGDQVHMLREAAELSAASPMTRLFFHAITDELMLRWGLMSGLLWVMSLVFRQPRGRPRAAIAWAAILVGSTLYVIGYVPSIIWTADPAGVLLARTVIVSALAGIAYGWLYWKHGLESAVLAHVLANGGLILFEGLALL